MANEKIREALKKNNLRQWQLADLLNMHEGVLCKKMRYELPIEEQKFIISLIERGKKNDE